MKQRGEESKRWNLFVRELEDLLRERERNLNDLISKAELHPEKVRRLKQSLLTPKFHLLSPEDLEQVLVTFHFTAEEHLRLRAAILATAVEETLMNRIDAENALRAAEEIFPLLIEALRQRFGQQRGLAATRRAPLAEERSTSDALEPILEQFDQGMLALYSGRQVKTHTERMRQTAIARDCFQTVLIDLDALSAVDPTIASTETWQVWYQETQKALAIATEMLVRLSPS